MCSSAQKHSCWQQKPQCLASVAMLTALTWFGAFPVTYPSSLWFSNPQRFFMLLIVTVVSFFLIGGWGEGRGTPVQCSRARPLLVTLSAKMLWQQRPSWQCLGALYSSVLWGPCGGRDWLRTYAHAYRDALAGSWAMFLWLCSCLWLQTMINHRHSIFIVSTDHLIITETTSLTIFNTKQVFKCLF